MNGKSTARKRRAVYNNTVAKPKAPQVRPLSAPHQGGSRRASVDRVPYSRDDLEKRYRTAGEQHDSGKRYKFFVREHLDFRFFAVTMILLVIGLIMLFSASYAYAYSNDGDSMYYITRQLRFAVAGIVVMLFVSHIDYHYLRLAVYPLFAVSVVCLVIVLFLPPYEGEFYRWIAFGPVSFQPSEVVKFSVILLFAHLMAKNAAKMKKLTVGILPFALILGVIAVLMLLEPHLSGTILIVTIGVSMMIIGGCSLKWLFGLAGIGGTAAAAYLIIGNKISYVGDRLQAWLDKSFEPLGARWQINQSLYAIGSGGLLGTGIGNSKQKYLYVSEPQNDFIFSIVAEELGFLGSLLIISLFVYLVWRGFRVAMNAPDRFGGMLVFGIVIQIGIQAALNIAVVTDTVPNTGISLPFFSSGGTALLLLLFEIGVVLSVSRSQKVSGRMRRRRTVPKSEDTTRSRALT